MEGLETNTHSQKHKNARTNHNTVGSRKQKRKKIFFFGLAKSENSTLEHWLAGAY